MICIRWTFCCLIVVAATSAHAAGYFVDADAGNDANPGISPAYPFRTIQRAIEEALQKPGPDMIHIASSDYEENLTINDPDKLTLTGSDGCAVIAPNGSGNVISISSGDVTISSLTITGGENGIQAEGTTTSLALRDVNLSGNAERGLDAEGVLSVTIARSVFAENGGDGLKVEAAEAVQIRDTAIWDNGSDGIDLEVIRAVDLTDLTVDGNADEGLEVDDCGSVHVVQGTYSSNADDGLDIDNTLSIRIVSVMSMGNGGNGLQIEAE